MNLKQRRGHIYDADNPLNDESGDVKRPFKTSDILQVLEALEVMIRQRGDECSCELCEAYIKMINRTWRE